MVSTCRSADDYFTDRRGNSIVGSVYGENEALVFKAFKSGSILTGTIVESRFLKIDHKGIIHNEYDGG